ncbi:hypothetical protein TcCL_ESM09686 [Trypanosoma cruzi]|nr:hypothetical protein TcCL_ESM09686 [Trypanosoma cruzi]
MLEETDSLSAIEALRVAPRTVRDCVAERIWVMLLSLVKRGHPADLIFSPSHRGVPRNGAADKEATIAHDPCSNEASQSGTWNSLPPSRGYTVRKSRRKKKSRTPHARRSSG